MAEMPGISIIGPGKVGTAIGILAARAGLRVVAVGGRDLGKARTAAVAIGPQVRAGTMREAARAGGLILLTVTDDAIAPVCDELAGAGAFRRGAVVAHCSGALDSDELAPARERCSCRIASMHPLQTFPTVDAAVAKLPGTYFFCEGDPQAVEALERLASAIGGRPVRIKPEGKALYHAAAVMACNYLTALIDAAMALAEEAGIERKTAMSAMEPLVRSTVDNIFALGTEGALTGPIARGDVQTVRRHAHAIGPGRKDLALIYAALGARAIDLARRKGMIDTPTAFALMLASVDARPAAAREKARPRRRKPGERGRVP